jgi:hypothetical protein
MAGISSRQAEFIADLWEQTGEPFLRKDARGVPVVTHRDGFVQYVMREKDQTWAQGAVAQLKGKLAELGNKSHPTEMASAKQVAYGRNLDVQKNGKAVHDWEHATKGQAWQWIADLKAGH